MDANDEKGLTDRIERLELAVADISRRLDDRFRQPPAPSARPAASRPQKTRPAPVIPPKSAEWWLARGGAVLTLFALVLLYQYAVSHNWITPMIRVAFGTTIGAGLMILGNRLPRAPETTPDDNVGLREVLLGAALAAWYTTAYAAAVFYGLISLNSARIIFFALSIAGSWLALREKRALLALFALSVGFATPALLPSPTPSIPAFAIYVGTLAAVGMILFLMRGWQSVLWLTFIAFWWSTGAATSVACCSLPGAGQSARVSLTLLIALAGVAMVRVAILRRRLLGLGSHLYTESKRSDAATSLLTELAKNLSNFTGQPGGVDSPAVWVITLSTPLIAIAQLALIWPAASSLIWGTLALLAAAFAYRLASSPRAPSEEFTHVEAAATALWSLAASLWFADGLANQLHVSPSATYVIAASLHAFITIRTLRQSVFSVPTRLARLTALAIVLGILALELDARRFAPYWTLAELVGLAVTAWIAWIYRRSGTRSYSSLLAAGSYTALMLIDARVLGTISRPLVTASYAIAGTALLIASRNSTNSKWLRRLGGITLVVVIARLVMIDMAGVETIWRVLLFLGVGALFLFASHRMQSSGSAAPASGSTPTEPAS